MHKITERSLVDALAYCSIPRLPEVDDGESVWLKAIAKVIKSNGLEYFVYIEKDVDTLENKIVRDFGDTLSIYKVVEYYPFEFLKPRYVPELKGNKKGDRIEYLKKCSDIPIAELEEMTLKDLNTAVLKTAIKTQLEYEYGKKRT